MQYKICIDIFLLLLLRSRQHIVKKSEIIDGFDN